MKKLLILFLLAVCAVSVSAKTFRFKVTNTGKSPMTSMEISEKGKGEWHPFDIGGTIAPNTTVLLIWDEQPNEEDCKWSVRVKFANGAAKESVVDFCTEKSLKFSAE